MPKYECSTCKTLVDYSGPLPVEYPFCSRRCRMADLGRWFREQYAIEGPVVDEEGLNHRGTEAQIKKEDLD